MYPQVFGKYVLERELARGGMARVMLATLRGAGGFEKRLVVKQIRDELACDDDFVARFVEEAKTAVALAHPNIVPVYELGVELGTYFLAMELVEGASLSELLRASVPNGLSPEEGAYIGVEVCRALDYAHRRMNVVHRDITPRNVMVDEEGHVKVIDFGIAAPVATAPSGHGIFGSPGHMPPEQMEGRELTPAADVFAVATLLMEVWKNQPPFRRKTNEAVESAMRAAHPRPSDANIRLLPLDDVIASALALDPKARPQQADDLGRVLRRFLAGIDLGDLARQLGDRVRAFRENPPPHAEPSPVLARPPSRPTATAIGTRTFAVRELRDEPRAVTESSANLSTRRMASSAPAAADAPLARIVAVRTKGADVDLAALPTLATDGPRAMRAPRRGLAWVVVLGGCAAALAALFTSPRATRAVTHPPAGSAADEATSDTAHAPSAATAAATQAAPNPVEPALSATTVPASAASAPPAVHGERARLLLLGDGTQVTVDGVTYGPSPQHVTVDPGSHNVVFRFAATGESRSEVLTVRPGDRATLRADFTSAVPTVRVER
jgi:serine/threonine protein kinase